MTTAKTPNYSDSQEQELESVYTASNTDADRKEDVKNLAVKFGRTEASIRSKLSNMGIYIKPEKVSKATGEKVVRKPELVAQLAEKLGLEGDDVKTVASLEKATIPALKAVIAQMTFLEQSFEDV